MKMNRNDGRTCDQVRPIKISYDVLGYADASVLLEVGKTKVLTSVTLQQGVPPFLKGSRTGWLSAEYAMLPSATHQRTMREAYQGKRNPRNVEISRLISRCLRTTIDLKALGERNIVVDCDVLQADGGTRVACITAASIALELAALRWNLSGEVIDNVFMTRIAALSVGVVNGTPLADLAYTEDSSADADFNFVVTEHGDLIEVQGTAEKAPVPWSVFESLKNMAITGAQQLFDSRTQACFPETHPEMTRKPTQLRSNHRSNHQHQGSKKATMFSLGNRVNS